MIAEHSNDAIETSDLIFQFPGREMTRLCFSGFRIERGRKIGLFGESGSGKTSLLNLLRGIIKPQKGTILLFGKEIERMNENELAILRLSSIGSIFQRFDLIDYLSVFDNVLLPYHIKPGLFDRKEMEYRAIDLLKRTGLYDLKKRFPEHLSCGEMQRVALCRSLVTKPALILADEPTSNLDNVNAGRLLTLLEELVADFSATLLLASHDRQVLDAMETILSIDPKGGDR